MTDTDWETNTTKPRLMLKQALKHASGRKLQILSCSICRLIWDWIPAPDCQAVVAAAERMVDGVLSPQEYQSFCASASQQRQEIAKLLHSMTEASTHRPAESIHFQEEIRTASIQLAAADIVMASIAENLKMSLQQQIRTLEHMIQSQLLRPISSCPQAIQKSDVRKQLCDRIREIIENPHRMRDPVRGIPISAAARNIAEGCFHDQAFDRLPILADALEESGFPDQETLEHFRSERQHFRGCWALDRVLGRR